MSTSYIYKQVICVKLDFAKAYDRVDHSFLWATLKAMRLDSFVIQLIQGLVLNVEAKVHMNGLFTESFPLEHGVRQGDPLSPTPFVLSSQPLMRLLEDMRTRGELIGLKITRDESLLYQLFANNIALFVQNLQHEFEQAMGVVRMFERASGASLNLSKSVIIPLTNPIPQEWCVRTGCRIL